MNKIFAIIRREFVERVRTRVFLVMTLVLPLLMTMMLVLPALMMRGNDRTLSLAIVDATSTDLGSRIQAALMTQRLGGDSGVAPRYLIDRISAVGREAAVRDSLVALTGLARDKASHSFDGVLVVSDKALDDRKMDYFGSNVGSMEAMGRLEGTLQQVLMTARLQHAGIDPTIVGEAMGNLDLVTTKVADGKATGESGGTSFALAYVMGFLLYFGVLIYGQQTGTSVVEEKSSRIMEILASSLTPFQMLLGKVIGVGVTGLLQMGIWAGTAFLLTNQRVAIAGLVGVDPAAIRSIPIPTMAPGLLAVFLIYFMLGFLLYGAIYAGIGSMCNTTQEVQQTAMPVMMLIMVGFFSVFSLLGDPNGSLGRILSMIPFFSPFVMPVRWSLVSVPWIELVFSLSLSVLTLLASAWVAGRIYRTGILMYGKKPGLGEIFRWIRA